MIRFRSAAFAFACVVATAAALPATAAPVYNFAPVTAEMQSFVQTYALDGASLRVNKAGSVVYRRAFGNYSLSTQVPIASASKWVSALAIARIVEKGQMRWSDTVGQYFPGTDPSKRNITLEQLFSHTSGLPAGDESCMSNPLYTLATCANHILQKPLIGTPGQVFAYGGNSMQVAGRMAEIATGKAWDDIFIAEMTTPLRLTATDYATSSTSPNYVRNTNPRIAGGVRSTLEDYGKIVDMVLANGCLDSGFPNNCMPGRRFLTRATIEFMARDRTVGTVDISRPPTSTGYGYGLGQWIDPSSPLIVSSPGAFGFTPWVDRNSQVAGVLLVQDVNTRLFDDINAIRQMVNVVVADGMGYYPAPVLPSQRVIAADKAAVAAATAAPSRTRVPPMMRAAR
ncbi:MAG: class A beta-lactamase-related serine hydrolase [Lysobacter sp.]|nr:MAG: class A beta-lactamase-related serine hydrolase [Lysobacter sp.]